MIEREAAVRAVEEQLERDYQQWRAVSADAVRMAVVRVKEHELVWIASWQSTEFVRTQNSRYMLVGNGPYLVDWTTNVLGRELEIVRKDPDQRGFQVQPKRWAVERTFSWLTAHRRLARDYATIPARSETMLRWAMIGIMVRRLTRVRPPSPNGSAPVDPNFGLIAKRATTSVRLNFVSDEQRRHRFEALVADLRNSPVVAPRVLDERRVELHVAAPHVVGQVGVPQPMSVCEQVQSPDNRAQFAQNVRRG